MKQLDIIYKNLQQDLKAFLFFTIFFSIFRIVFIYIYSYQLTDTSDIWLSIFYGFRLSLKTVGWITLICFIISTLPSIFTDRWRCELVRKIWYCVVILLFTTIFFIKIVYYKVFNAGFDLMLINGVHDDFAAILDTAIREYQLFLRLPLAIVLSVVLIFILLKILKTKTYNLSISSKKTLYIYSISGVIALSIFFIFVRYGGAFNYANSITWENSARLKSNLLNEAILDDAQALYRVKSMYKRLRQTINADISDTEIRKWIGVLGGISNSTSIEEAFVKEVKTKRLDKKPQNIIFILGETYSLWPFLPEYKELGLAEKGLKFQNSPDSLSVEFMLSHGSGTMPTLNGFLSGLADTGLYANYEKESFNSVYGTGIGAVMKALGYKTVFWYGGFDSWQNIKSFVLAQSFDEFHSSNEFQKQDGNSWGSTDKLLFERIKEYMVKNRGQKTFYFILTTSNHPPYSIDVEKEGFDKNKVKAALPKSILDDEKTLNELGHIWYADQAMGNFIEEIKDDFSDTLFVITGDHSERFNFAKDVDLKTFSAVPCIFYSSGIDMSKIELNRIGSHMQIIPTLVDLIGEEGHIYSSILPSLLDKESNVVFNHKLWANETNISMLSGANVPAALLDRAEAAKKVSIWRIKKGDKI